MTLLFLLNVIRNDQLPDHLIIEDKVEALIWVLSPLGFGKSGVLP